MKKTNFRQNPIKIKYHAKKYHKLANAGICPQVLRVGAWTLSTAYNRSTFDSST